MNCCLAFVVLLGIGAEVNADAYPHPVDHPESPVMLAGPWVPADPHTIDFEALPRIPSEHTVVSDVRAADGVNQHNYLAHFDGKFWAMWSDGPGVEDRVGQRVKYATSPDGLAWSTPKYLTPVPPNSGTDSPHYNTRTSAGYRYISRGFWERDGELLALASLDEADGFFGPGLELHAFRFNADSDGWDPLGVVYDNAINNFPPKMIPSGEWMMSRRTHDRHVHFLVGGVTGFDDWESYPAVFYGDARLKAEEPYWWKLPDGNLLALYRDNQRSGFLFRSFSTDNGRTWHPPVKTNFPDATSKFNGLRLRDGRYVLVSNANPEKRDPLVLSVSDDGIVFDRMGYLTGSRWVDYPHVIEHDGHLLVAFAGSRKQTCEVLKIKVADLSVLDGQLEEPALDISVRVPLGEDDGRGLGSLFEAKDAEGRVMFGAGFDDAHSTYMRDNHRQVVFYAKTPDVTETVVNLGKPFGPEHNGSRLQVRDGALLAFHRHGTPLTTLRLGEGDVWEAFDAPWKENAPRFGGVQRVGNEDLVFDSEAIYYGDEIIYGSEKGYGRYYYVHGQMFLYHAKPDMLFVAAWQPGDRIDVAGAESFPIVGNVFTYGVYGDEVLVATNVGEFYSYRDGVLTQIRATDGKSWQAYSMLQLRDRVVIGHYPTGSLYEYGATGLQLFDPPIPVPEGAKASGREAQTLAIYGGYLYAGVWPWGEVWRFDPETKEWALATRVFERPEINDTDQEPFARAMQGKPGAYNYWGQRVTSLANHGDALYIATMNKQGKPYVAAEHDFMDQETLAQYGAIHRLRAPGQIAAGFTWKDETVFRFIASGKRLMVYQDGELTGEAAVESPASLRAVESIAWGDGVYGPYRGSGTLAPVEVTALQR